MSNRRTFLTTAIAASVTGLATSLPIVQAKANTTANLALGIIYTQENPGKWAKKVGGHLPTVKVEGKKVTITTDHSMSEKHYIVRHTLVTPTGEVLAEKTFTPTDEAVSVFELADNHAVLYATSFCNKHDLWLAEFTV